MHGKVFDEMLAGEISFEERVDCLVVSIDPGKNIDNSISGRGLAYFSTMDIQNFIWDETFIVRDNNRDIYFIYFGIENNNFDIGNDHSFLSELENYRYGNSNYMNNKYKIDNLHFNI